MAKITAKLNIEIGFGHQATVTSTKHRNYAGLVGGMLNMSFNPLMAHGFESFTRIVTKGYGKLDLDG